MRSDAKTVDEYVQSLPEDRRHAISAIRKVILDNLPAGYEECMGYGMIGYVVPHSLYPKGYQCNPKLPLPFANLGSQKNHMALYLMCIYGDEKSDQWFRTEWEKTGRKLDAGKGCIRFKKLEDVPLEVVGKLIARMPVEKYTARIEAVFAENAAKRREARASKPKSKAKAKTQAKSKR